VVLLHAVVQCLEARRLPHEGHAALGRDLGDGWPQIGRVCGTCVVFWVKRRSQNGSVRSGWKHSGNPALTPRKARPPTLSVHLRVLVARQGRIRRIAGGARGTSKLVARRRYSSARVRSEVPSVTLRGDEAERLFDPELEIRNSSCACSSPRSLSWPRSPDLFNHRLRQLPSPGCIAESSTRRGIGKCSRAARARPAACLDEQKVEGASANSSRHWIGSCENKEANAPGRPRRDPPAIRRRLEDLVSPSAASLQRSGEAQELRARIEVDGPRRACRAPPFASGCEAGDAGSQPTAMAPEARGH
jgi:hypothetical protein